MSDPVAEIRRLQELHAQGVLTDDEFTKAKTQLLNQVGSASERPRSFAGVAPSSRAATDIAVWVHISALAGYILPIAGFIAPIVIWQINKQNPLVDAHGKVVINWIISSVIYAVVSAILSIVLIGILGLIALFILGIVFPIMGAVRASRNELWPYPLSIKFFK